LLKRQTGGAEQSVVLRGWEGSAGIKVFISWLGAGKLIFPASPIQEDGHPRGRWFRGAGKL